MTIESTIARAVFKLRKNAPVILTVVGAAGVVATAVLASRATLKAMPVVNNIKNDVTYLKTREVEEEVDPETGTVLVKDIRRDVTMVYLRGAGEIAKIYAPAVTMGAVSVISILAAHKILQGRFANLAIAYKTLESAYSAYRHNIVERYGSEVDREVASGVRVRTITDENGKKTEEKYLDPSTTSIYTRLFDETISEWTKDHNYNYHFLLTHQSFWNQRLQSRGYVFLNEVYEDLGFEPTPEGQLVGWIIGPENENYIDFGIMTPVNSKAINFVHSRADNVWWLDFNVDGVIFNKI